MDEEKIERLINMYQALSPEIQYALLWVIEHWKIVDFLVQGEKVPEKEIEELIQKAMEKEDYLLVVILVYKRVYDINEF